MHCGLRVEARGKGNPLASFLSGMSFLQSTHCLDLSPVASQAGGKKCRSRERRRVHKCKREPSCSPAKLGHSMGSVPRVSHSLKPKAKRELAKGVHHPAPQSYQPPIGD